MAKNLVKKHGDFFKVMSLMATLFVIGIIIVLSYYVINATTTTESKAAGRKKQCADYKSSNCPVGCVAKGKWCQSVSTLINNGPQQNLPGAPSTSGSSSVKTRAGYCLTFEYDGVKLDCNNNNQQPVGSFKCPSPVNYKTFYCCPPGQVRLFDSNHTEPGTCGVK